MTSVQNYLSGHQNLARSAALTASSVKPSRAIERLRTSRKGNGRALLGGSYTGGEAVTVDVKILDTGGTPRNTAPTFAGVGNGELTVLAIDAAAPMQGLTFTLADLGVETQPAALDVAEVRIQAKAPGAAGNSIRITISPQLTSTPLGVTLLASWDASQATKEGQQWDFGAAPLSAKGELDAAAPRLRFGTDPQVYRQWRQLKDGAWRFGFSPALERSLPKDAPVYSVTGGYSATVTDGAVTETYADLVTFFDLLTALADSALVQVAGVVAADRTVGGQAAVDVPLRTSAWLLSADGGVKLADVGVPTNAPTQAVTVRCTNADTIGRERWEVSGTVSGSMASNILTGQLYTHSAIQFLIPSKPAPESRGDWSFSFDPIQRGDTMGEPSVCLRPFKLGSSATPRSVRFVYKRRPPEDCDCRAVPAPLVSDKCLGLTPEGGEIMSLDTAYQSRLEALYQWRMNFIDSNIELKTSTEGFGYIASDPRDIELVNGACSEFAQAIGEVYEVVAAAEQWDIELARFIATTTPLEGLAASSQRPVGRKAIIWEPHFDLQRGDWVSPSIPDGRLFKVLSSGQSGDDEPDWDAPLPIIDSWNEVKYVESYTYWTSGQAVAEGKRIEPGDGNVYIATADGVSGSVLPSFDGPQVQDGTVTWNMVIGSSPAIHVSGDVSLRYWSYHEPSSGHFYHYTVNSVFGGLLSSGTISAPPGSSTETEQMLKGKLPYLTPISSAVEMVAARMDYVRTIAGIVPKSDASSSTAGSCWQDPGDSMWWVDPTGRYLPAFTNQPYISARRDPETGKPYSTMEFGFGLVVACPERLLEGDSITVTIHAVDARKPYNVGDMAVLQTVNAGPAWLSGGIDGDDRQTWRVSGSSSGPLSDYIVPTDGTPPGDYIDAGVSARLALGGIPFALGDSFTFAVEAAQYQWRSGSGAWSAAADIPSSGTAQLADGLELTFEPGSYPSFAAGDMHSYLVHQPHAASHVKDAQATSWAWAGDTATLELDLGAEQPLGTIALARYTLPPGATVQASLSTDGTAWEVYPLNITANASVCVQALSADTSARYIRLQVSGAAGGSLGYVWAGQPLTTAYHATSAQRRRRWATSRSDAPNAAGMYAGAGDGWTLVWQDCLTQQDASALLELVDYAQRHDEPIIFVPHYRHPQDAALVRCTPQALDVSDVFEYQPDDADQRLLSASLELEPVYA